MSRRLDFPIAAAAWLLGFAWIAWRGTWAPLALLASAAAVRLLVTDSRTRALLRRASPLTLTVGVVAGLAAVGCTYAFYPLVSDLFPALPRATARLYGVLRAGNYTLTPLLALITLVAACEEVVWRGATLAPAETAAGGRLLTTRSTAQVAFGAAIYGATHLVSGLWLLAALAAGFGFIWGMLRVATRSLWPTIVCHLLWDYALLGVWPLVGSPRG